jgi:hypothetical protein
MGLSLPCSSILSCAASLPTICKGEGKCLRLLVQCGRLACWTDSPTWLSASINRNRNPVKSTDSRPAKGLLRLGGIAHWASAAEVLVLLLPERCCCCWCYYCLSDCYHRAGL